MKNLLLIISIFHLYHFKAQLFEFDFGVYNKKVEITKNESVSIIKGNIFKKEMEGIFLIQKDDDYNYLKTPNENIKIHLSTTLHNDTTSVSYKNEYLNIRPAELSGKPITYLHQRYVTNSEWNSFKQYVKDSIARRILAYEFPDNFLIEKFDQEGELMDEYAWDLNWEKKFRYNSTDPRREENYEYATILAQMFFNESERINEKKEIDSRKLSYEYTNLNGDLEIVNIYRDSTLWVNEIDIKKVHNVDDILVSTYNSYSYFDDKPVTGINAEQAKGYLAWKQKFHQKELDKNQIPLKVIYTLPTLNEINESKIENQTISIPHIDLNKWRVTNKDYSQFVKYVLDSIAFRILGIEFPEEFLVETYDDELFVKDESDWHINYYPYTFPYRKTRRNIRDYPEYISTLRNYNFDYNNPNPKSLNMQHYFYDFKNASITGEFINPRLSSYASELKILEIDEGIECEKLIYYSCKNLNKDGRPICKDLLLGNTNIKCYNNDVRSHLDRSKFIIKELINVYPGIKYRSNRILDTYDSNSGDYIPFEDNLSDTIKSYNFNESPDKLITNITYGQFVAYWLWKNRTDFSYNDANEMDLKSIIDSQYIPSEKEFKLIQNGRDIKHPKETHNLPTPTFRYCISFYPKTS